MKLDLLKTDFVLDAKGLPCPMPVVKTKKAITDMEAGQVLEVRATEKGSIADLKAWSERSGHQYLGLLQEENVLRHFIRKMSNDKKIEKRHPNVVTNEELELKLKASKPIVVLDVREAAEYAFNHIPTAISIPLGELENRMGDLNKEAEIYVICRTGNRSDVAAQKLAEHKFTNVFNVIPGMGQWSGQTTGINK